MYLESKSDDRAVISTISGRLDVTIQENDDAYGIFGFKNVSRYNK